MPVLAKEPVCFPEDLLDNATGEAAGDRDWCVLHTRPRSEKAIARKLRREGIPYFLPQFERRYRKQRRMIRSQLPLFPGYVFLLGNEEQRTFAWSTDQVANVLEVPDQGSFVNDIRSIHGLVESGVDVAPEERIAPGDKAEIVAGPFKGREGIILRRGKRLHLVVAVDFLQRGASVEVETSDIRWIP